MTSETNLRLHDLKNELTSITCPLDLELLRFNLTSDRCISSNLAEWKISTGIECDTVTYNVAT
jgi:hypothetical protein